MLRDGNSCVLTSEWTTGRRTCRCTQLQPYPILVQDAVRWLPAASTAPGGSSCLLDSQDDCPCPPTKVVATTQRPALG